MKIITLWIFFVFDMSGNQAEDDDDVVVVAKHDVMPDIAKSGEKFLNLFYYFTDFFNLFIYWFIIYSFIHLFICLSVCLFVIVFVLEMSTESCQSHK